MVKERKKEHKPLSFSTTMRNPSRIADFLNHILPHEGKILTNEIIDQVVFDLIKNKLYKPVYISQNHNLKEIYESENVFNDNDVYEIILKSPQNHKEAGFEKGWPSRFDTWYKLPMEYGFLYYEMNTPIIISTTGHMLIDAVNEEQINNEKIQNIFLNAMMKYQTNNPFRKNANDNAPLPLLLEVIKLLNEDPSENGSGVFRSELSLLICWPNHNAKDIYNKIKNIRAQYNFTYGDEVIYEICLDILGASDNQRNRFKISQITGEAVDEFIRKMRITGVISLRGQGRFLDFNKFESLKINYILDNYSKYEHYTEKKEFFLYMGSIDTKILELQKTETENIEDLRIQTLNKWASEYSKDEIYKELEIVSGKGESKNTVLKIIDKPTRLEFLTSIALKQNFVGLTVQPNYPIDDEGLPRFTAPGGKADIECYDDKCYPLVEVTLMRSKMQGTNEIPSIVRHIIEIKDKKEHKAVFAILVAPIIHSDTFMMTCYFNDTLKSDIVLLTIIDFIKKIQTNEDIYQMLKYKPNIEDFQS